MTWLLRQNVPEVADAIWQVQHAESALTVLRAIADLRESGTMLADRAVRECRAEGITWDAIADAMRVSRQAVHRRYASIDAARESGEPTS